MVVVASFAHADDSVDFNRDVRGILSDKCFLCHGPDESTREAGLRLDVRESAIDSGAIAPGNAEASEILARVNSDDPDAVMPPPTTGKDITDREREVLARWIKAGADYDAHWAFVAPQTPESPKFTLPEDRRWIRNGIDRFVLAKLKSMKLSPSPPADPSTLARRIALDLTGLPPTPGQLDDISRSSEARSADHARWMQAWIDMHIDSDRFGERWARWWLDAARYADSAGYEKDMQRQVFFYRDWVIDAMSRDMPYDEFVIKQIAGDLLPGAGQDERVATGFLRNSMTNEEGGADPEQFRVEGMFDRVDAIGKAILGITTQCAQCHTHKYDPISHHEYYQMFAALNDFHEASITVYTAEQALRRDEVRAIVAGHEDVLRALVPDWKERTGRWADDHQSSLPTWSTVTPTDVPYEGQKFEILDDGSILSESYAPTKAENPFSSTLHVGTITAVRMDALTHPQLPRGGPGRSIDGTGALTEFKLKITPSGPGAKPIEVKFVRAMADVEPLRRDLKPQYRDRDPDKDDRVVGPIEYAFDDDLKTAWTTDIGPGRSNQSRHAIFVPAEPVIVNGEATLTFTMVQKHGGWNSDDNQNFLIGRYRFSITDAKDLPEIAVASAVETILGKPRQDWTASDWDAVFTQWRRLPENLAGPNTAFAKTESSVEAAWTKYPETATQLVVQSLAKPRETFVLARGDFLNQTDRVQADAPEFLNPMRKADAPDRLRFARWLVSNDSPTTARVVVNRIWQAYFGRGLVTTPEDFGFQSSQPSHPELLDFLATELMDNDWSLKHIHRLIVDSATYRQQSSAPADAWQQDPVNQWLGRGPRFRMDAEMVRDSTLSASGLLVEQVGGPSVYPPAPDFLFVPPTSYGPKIWDTHTDGNQYRRSLYVHQYRSVPFPPLQVFDAPKGDAACVRRGRSNTPLQALVLLNEPQFVEAARGLATRVLRELPANETKDSKSMDADRITLIFRYCTGRSPDADEAAVVARLLESQRQVFADESDAALSQWIGVRVERCRQLIGTDGPELAAWMVVARTILNLDETITKS
ncbi:Planctomycete cytochrome C [Rubripirellula tenax]|uniref:Planctomycete cytochrome C n=2 Tax=Rubripirellula tenax TaxID=2528015 RepID=A0A5C6EIC4_9BACT|nr:Planctomycete cytochrome C [Rubripirellula tenax]